MGTTDGATGRATASMSPIAPRDFGFAQARHLLWRAGFGGTSEQVRTLVSWGPAKSVDYLLDPAGVAFEDAAAFDKDIMRPATPEERRMVQEARRRGDEDALARVQAERQRREAKDREQIRSMERWWLRRMVETPRPLEEKIALVWHGHFATGYRAIENSYHMYLQNGLFRAKGLANFGDLLRGIIRDPAMLKYLNNDTNRKGKPNENLAREIMELFALGLNQYGEQDIKEGARALTGYTFEDDAFVFDRRAHDTGVKAILGRKGTLDGDEFVGAILAHPACPRFVASRLYHAFVADVPPDERGGVEGLPPEQRSAVLALAETLGASSYELRPMLRRLFMSEHFYDPRFVGEQIKSPVQLIVGAMRSLLAPARDLSILADALDFMGQRLFFPPSVKGWSGGRAWINTSTLFVRQNIVTFLLTGKKPRGYDASAQGERYDPTPLLADLDEGRRGEAAAVSRHLLELMLPRVPDEAPRAIQSYFANAGGKIDRDTIVGAMLLIAAMPEYQLC